MTTFVIVAASGCGARPTEPAPPPRPVASVAATSAPATLPRIRGPFASLSTSCGLRADGQLTCWAPIPAEIATRRDLVAVASTSTGEHFWLDSAGKLQRSGLDGAPLREAQAPGAAPFRRLWGGSVPCALDASGALWCAYYDREFTRESWAKGAIVEVASTYGTRCAVLADGKLTCVSPGAATKQGIVPGIDDATHVSVGDSHVCALRRSGKVTCWGTPRQGNLGAVPAGGDRVDVPGIDDAVAIAGEPSGWTTCVVRQSGKVTCWGMSRPLHHYSAELGPIDLPIDDAAQIVLDGERGCAASRNGVVRCFGDLVPWQPEPVPGIAGATALAVSSTRTCVLVPPGELRCWGERSRKVGGYAVDSIERSPWLVHDVRDATALAMPHSYSAMVEGCVVRKAGSVWCWRGDDIYEFGVRGAVSVAVGQEEVCALLQGGGVSCVQARALGEADGPKCQIEAHRVPGVSNAIAIAASDCTCALLRNGAMSCWGVQQWPADAASGLDVLAMGYRTACGIRRGGRVVCWGSNVMGQVAAPSSLFASATEVGIDDAISVASTSNSSCAVRRSGGLACWGKLDDVGRVFTPSPAFLHEIALPEAQAVAVGATHACVLRKGQVLCMGSDEKGQLGLGGGAFGVRQVSPPTSR